jgi:hypothetical protein
MSGSWSPVQEQNLFTLALKISKHLLQRLQQQCKKVTRLMNIKNCHQYRVSSNFDGGGVDEVNEGPIYNYYFHAGNDSSAVPHSLLEVLNIRIAQVLVRNNQYSISYAWELWQKSEKYYSNR